MYQGTGQALDIYASTAEGEPYDIGYTTGVIVNEPAPIPFWLWLLLGFIAYKALK